MRLTLPKGSVIPKGSKFQQLLDKANVKLKVNKDISTDYRPLMYELFKMIDQKDHQKVKIPELTEKLSTLFSLNSTLRLSRERKSILDQIYLKADNLAYATKYRQILRSTLMDHTVFDIVWAIDHENYEMAITLFMKAVEYYDSKLYDIGKEVKQLIEDGGEERAKYLENELVTHLSTTKYKWLHFEKGVDWKVATRSNLYRNLKAFQLLSMARERNDTTNILNILDILAVNDPYALLDVNYTDLMNSALQNKNPDVASHVYYATQDRIEYTQGFLIQMGRLFVSCNYPEPAIDILQKIDDENEKKILLLDILARAPFYERWLIINDFVEAGLEINYNTVMTSKICSSDRINNFAILTEFMSAGLSIVSEHVKKLMIYSLLKNADDHRRPASLIFILSYLCRRSLYPLLDHAHFTICFHTLSYCGFKIVSFHLLNLALELGIKPTLKDYLFLMECQLHGEEHQTLYLMIVAALRTHSKLSTSILDFLKSVSDQTNDTKLESFLENVDDATVESTTELFDTEDVEKSKRSKDARTSYRHEVLPGFKIYSFSHDNRSYGNLLF
ncbi:hypothetical protein CANARDRAFT_20686 [[Candida] arabinofermentans NRRL YB-2248]|uniref:Uncharacterized protein n=1 Tax=[Candida] arabinofermentans NRRL YB-2248 TaxID=983967 RepID=A0A1E4T878_9ASCO|nr:hypothetical protein CANARDRAFT_20686 [[Candida] arabinofermentans NRRL YB-2248]